MSQSSSDDSDFPRRGSCPPPPPPFAGDDTDNEEEEDSMPVPTPVSSSSAEDAPHAHKLHDDSVLKPLLDALDKIRFDVYGMTGDDSADFANEVMNYIPQVVVTGAQSAGKSAVLEQLSGVKLPQKAERCTRMAVNLKMRREPSATRAICLKRPEGQADEQYPGDASADTAKAIDYLQELAIKESGNKQFAKGYTVEVSVTGPDLANITLVDLPGFTNLTPQDSKLVLDIVTPYLEMDNTILLHVCKGDTDYGSVLGNDIISPYKHKVIPVFTHMDRLQETQQASILKTIIKETEAPRFAILGTYDGPADKESTAIKNLPAFEGNGNKFKYGRMALLKHLEAIQVEGLKQHLPAAIKSLKAMETKLEKRGKEIKKREPASVMTEATDLMFARFTNHLEKNANDEQRPLIDAFVIAMHRLGLFMPTDNDDDDNDDDDNEDESDDGDDEDEDDEDDDDDDDGDADVSTRARKLEAGEVLEVGTVVFTVDSAKHKNKPAMISAVRRDVDLSTKELFHVYTVTGLEDEPDREVHEAHMRPCEDSRKAVLDTLQRLAKKKTGLRNKANVDPHKMLEPIMSKFASDYGAVLRAFVGCMARTSQKFLDDTVFTTNHGRLSDMAKPVMDELKRRVQVEFDVIVKDCNKWCRDAERWNRAPLVFASNEPAFHAQCCVLTDQDAVAAATTGETSTPLVPTYHRLRAHVYLQRKFVSEAAVKQICLAFNVHLKNRIKRVKRNLEGMEKFVREPHGWAEERARLKTQGGILKSAIEQLTHLG